MDIGNKIELCNAFTNEIKEYEFIGIDMDDGAYIFKSGCSTQILTKEYVEFFEINKKKVKYMNFIEATKLLELDKNIKLMKRTKDFEITYGLIGINLTITDILADDWYVVKNEKLHTFEEAFKALKEGATVHRANERFSYSLDSEHSFALLVKGDIIAKDWIIKNKEETK